MAHDIPHLSEFERLVFFTGAGLSAESGIPTYRGDGGVWGKYDYREYACQRAFDRDPAKVWVWHDERRAAVAKSLPNIAHELIAKIQGQRPGTRVITQNIDGLHQKAGAVDVIELHGSLWRLRCEACGSRRENFDLPLEPKHCECGQWWRPDLVWFEDMLDMPVIEAAVSAIEECDCLVSIGTSGVVYPAAEMPIIAMRAGALTIEINPEETPLSALYAHSLRGTATELMKLLAG